MQAERPLTYQARCIIQAFKQAAYALGALALGHGKSAALHGAASTAWAALSTSIATAVKLGRIKQEEIDALWVEPYDPYPNSWVDEIDDAVN